MKQIQPNGTTATTAKNKQVCNTAETHAQKGAAMTTIESTVDTFEVEQLKTRVNYLQTVNDELLKDIQCIDEALQKEAQDRGWCSEYDDFVENINNDLKRCSLEPRIKDFTASVTIAVSFQCSPSDSDDKIRDIMRALHAHGDNLDGELYTIGDWHIDHIEQD